MQIQLQTPYKYSAVANWTALTTMKIQIQTHIEYNYKYI